MRSEAPYPTFGEREIGLGVLLFAFLGAPVAWSLHFGAIYVLDAVLCTTGRGGAVAFWTYATTAAFALVSVVSGVVAYRRWRELSADERELDEAAARARGRTTILLVMGIGGSVLFTLFIVLEGLVPLFVAPCSVIHP